MNYHNHDIEKAVLGRIIYDGDYLKVCDVLESRHFNSPDHAEIYEAYQALFLKSKTAPDVVDIAQAIRKASGKNILNLLNACQSLAMSAWNVEEKAEMIKALWMRRELQELGHKLTTSPQESDELVTETMDTVLGLQGTKEAKATIHVKDMIVSLKEQVEISVAYQRSGEALPDVIYTGFPGVDAQIGGLLPGEVTIIGGRPGMGKTSFVNCVATNVAQAHPVLYFSFDMPKRAVLKDMACAYGEISHAKVRTGTIDDREKELFFNSLNQIEQFNLTMNDTDNRLDKMMLASKRWRMLNPEGPCLIIMDYVQLVYAQGIRSGDTTAMTSYVAKKVSSMAKDLEATIIPLAQLNRSVESRGGDKRPMLSDLRESGELEQIAQNVIFPYRPEYYGFETDEEGSSTQGLAEMMIAKNRNGVRNAIIKQHFIGEYKKFGEWYAGLDRTMTPIRQLTEPKMDFKQSQSDKLDVPF